MNKWIAILITLALLCALPALAENAVDVTMEGETYRLVLDSVDIVDGKLTVVMEGFGDTLRMDANGAMLAGIPEARYGDEVATISAVNIAVGAPFTFTFERDSLPDAIWVNPYDGGDAVLLWQAEDATGEATDEPAGEPTEASAGDSGDSDAAGATFSLPAVPNIVVPEIKVPALPKVATPAVPKIVVPEIPKVAAPSVNVPRLTAPDPIDPAAEEAAYGEAEEEASGEAGAVEPGEVLDALGEDVYRDTYAALLAGEVVQKGSKGDVARGVQQTLAAFGQDIAVDGNVGPKSIAALNAVQEAFGLEQTETLDAEGYAALLPRLLTVVDPDGADGLMYGRLGGEFDYMRACAFVAQGRFYSARQAFEESQWGDWEDRAAACAQAWPKTGQLYKNPDVKGGSTQLSVQFNSDPDTAMLVKIYTSDDVLARTLFIGGTGKATTSLPAGAYVVKDGTGKTWYGEEEAFGQEGYYETMSFGDGEREVELKKNYSSTITVNVQEVNPDAEGVGSYHEDWGSF